MRKQQALQERRCNCNDIFRYIVSMIWSYYPHISLHYLSKEQLFKTIIAFLTSAYISFSVSNLASHIMACSNPLTTGASSFYASEQENDKEEINRLWLSAPKSWQWQLPLSNLLVIAVWCISICSCVFFSFFCWFACFFVCLLKVWSCTARFLRVF